MYFENTLNTKVFYVVLEKERIKKSVDPVDVNCSVAEFIEFCNKYKNSDVEKFSKYFQRTFLVPNWLFTLTNTARTERNGLEKTNNYSEAQIKMFHYVYSFQS